MDKAQAKKLSADLNKAVNELLKEHGITAKTNLRWSEDGEIRFTAEGKAETAAVSQVLEWTKNFGLAYKEGQTFRSGRRVFKLVDFNHRAPKYPWIALCPADGKKYKLSTEMVERALAA